MELPKIIIQVRLEGDYERIGTRPMPKPGEITSVRYFSLANGMAGQMAEFHFSRPTARRLLEELTRLDAEGQLQLRPEDFPDQPVNNE